jgi:DNA-binding NtrC family response regulator
VFPIELPPLRKRREDIPLLVNHFITFQNEKTGKHIRGFSFQAMRIAMDYPWPGNVRELENAVEHAFVLCNGERIEIFDLPVEVRRYKYGQHPRAASISSGTGSRRNHTFSRENLVELLDECGWNKAEAGRRLGVSRTAVWKYMKKWDIPLKRA